MGIQLRGKQKNEVFKMFSNGEKTFRRGDIYYCDFIDIGGSVQSGLRPALIIQNDVGNECSPTVIVAPITTIVKKKNQPTHVHLGTEFGLEEDSMVMLEQINTVDKVVHIKEYIGSVTDDEIIRKINKAIKISVMGFYRDKNHNDSKQSLQKILGDTKNE